MPSRFVEGFLKSWGVILASEIGDKTFFIAAIMAMRNSRQQVRARASHDQYLGAACSVSTPTGGSSCPHHPFALCRCLLEL